MNVAASPAWEAYKAALKAIPPRDVAEALGLHGRGSRYFCPACQPEGGKSPDLSASGEGFKCFKCGEGGDSIALAALALKLDFMGACSWIGERFNVPAPEKGSGTSSPTRRPAPARPRPQARRSPTATVKDAAPPAPTPPEVAAVYADLVERCTWTADGLAYCERRGWTAEDLRRFGVAWINEPARIFREIVNAHGEDLLRTAGLLTESGRFLFGAGGSWRHPLLFPFHELVDGEPRTVFLQARRYCSCDAAGTPCETVDAHGPKYLTAKRPIPCPWGTLALLGLDAETPLHVCEGIPDALSLALDGLRAVAILGVQNLREHLLRSLLPFRVVLCGNRDAAGEKFNTEAAARFAAYGKRVELAPVPEPWKDWNEIHAHKRRTP